MNHISESNLVSLANLFDDRKKSEYTFQGHRIIIEQNVGMYDYEILSEGYRRNEWHTWHSDEGFETEEQALKAAEKWIDNWEPNDDYYAQ